MGKPPIFKKLLGTKESNQEKSMFRNQDKSMFKNGIIDFKKLTPVRQFNRSTGNLKSISSNLNNSYRGSDKDDNVNMS